MVVRQLLLLVVLVLLAACAGQPPADPTAPAAASLAGELVVFATASLTDAFTQIGKEFEAANPGTRIIYNFAGSQQLAQQIAQGAPADVFAAAHARPMDLAMQSGRIVRGTQQVFVQNRLIVVLPADNPAGIEQLSDLARPGIKLVLAAADVPVGAYARDFLANAATDPAFGAGYDTAVLANLISEEQNVRAVLTKVLLGEADAGIVYSSDVAPAEAGQVLRLEIPDRLNPIAEYLVAAVQDRPHAALADAFIAYLLAPAGQDVLAQHGFIPIRRAG